MSGQSNDRDHVALARRYAEQVVGGEIVACQWVRFACRRQLDDLTKAEAGLSEWRFDAEAGARICKFAEKLPHVKGRWTSKLLILEPWQCFLLTTIFGWVHKETGLRRFRLALVVIPRKNGKSMLAAIIALYMLTLDGEPGAEVYSAATTRDQAKVSWEVAQRMVQRLPKFRESWGVEAMAHSITVESNAACFKPLSRDADSLEGLNTHAWFPDELHAHKTREVFDVLNESTGARSQPLGVITSTEGDNATGVFAEQVAYGQKVLSGTRSDDSYFALIFTIDKDDDWTTEAAWLKSNPNALVQNSVGIAPLLEDLRIRFRQAQSNPASQSSFLTKRLNVRVGAGEAYFNLLAWQNLCLDRSVSLADMAGKPCYIGIDLAAKSDITAKFYLFPEPTQLRVFCQAYLPGECLERGNPNYDDYRGWADQGWLSTTEGNVTDYDLIEEDLKDDALKYKILCVGYDPYGATQLITHLQAAQIPVLEVAQNWRQLSEPMKELGARILSGKIKHDGNPLLTWAIGNVEAKIDRNENVYPLKARAENKIDPAVAGIIAMNLYLRGVNGAGKPSIYEDAETASM